MLSTRPVKVFELSVGWLSRDSDFHPATPPVPPHFKTNYKKFIFRDNFQFILISSSVFSSSTAFFVLIILIFLLLHEKLAIFCRPRRMTLTLFHNVISCLITLIRKTVFIFISSLLLDSSPFFK